MEMYNLRIENDNISGYFSNEQIEMLSIVQCKNENELVDFVANCIQLKELDLSKYLEGRNKISFEELKRYVFKSYQDTFISHNGKNILENTLKRLDIKDEDKEHLLKLYKDKNNNDIINYIKTFIKERYSNSEEIFKFVNRFLSEERDQNKDDSLYDEFILLNNNLHMFNTLLTGGIKPELVINNLFDDNDKYFFDHYFIERSMDFAKKNQKHIRFNTLLGKYANQHLFDGKSKEEILKLLKNYVKSVIDFINEYNEKQNNRLDDGSYVVNAIDIFNEIISFNKNENNQYYNIWLQKYDITLEELVDVFKYAIDAANRPNLDNEGNKITYLYNETNLENPQKRKKVIETFKELYKSSNGLIDTLGTQMHINLLTNENDIKECFDDLYALQQDYGINIQITEFDLSLNDDEIKRMLKDNNISYEDIYIMKKNKIEKISEIINNSGVRLSGVGYWSLTDKTDCNLERVRDSLLKDAVISDIYQVPTVCGGLIPTFLKGLEVVNSMSEENNVSSIKL